MGTPSEVNVPKSTERLQNSYDQEIDRLVEERLEGERKRHGSMRRFPREARERAQRDELEGELATEPTRELHELCKANTQLSAGPAPEDYEHFLTWWRALSPGAKLEYLEFLWISQNIEERLWIHSVINPAFDKMHDE